MLSFPVTVKHTFAPKLRERSGRVVFAIFVIKSYHLVHLARRANNMI